MFFVNNFIVYLNMHGCGGPLNGIFSLCLLCQKAAFILSVDALSLFDVYIYI